MKRILPIIVISQFFCTSLWFAGNAIIGDLAKQFKIDGNFLAHLTSTVQFGFITGTLVFAILSIADRISPSKVFFGSAVIAAGINLIISVNDINLTMVVACRFMTGFFLAGIYPVGMKIAADYYEKGLGKSLGYLVGALVLGTAFPHLLKSMTLSLPWKTVIYTTSFLSVIGGLLVLLLIPDGPYRKAGQRPSLVAFLNGFRNKEFRSAAFGYFGHMWELYAFWTFVPVIVLYNRTSFLRGEVNVSAISFMVIAVGSIACVLGGYISQRFGEKITATSALLISCCCCLLSPIMLTTSSFIVFILFLLVWGMTVIADSPLFSTMVAKNAPVQSRGASLTIVNCVGFAITIISIQLVNLILNENNFRYVFLLLAIGPIVGLFSLFGSMKQKV